MIRPDLLSRHRKPLGRAAAAVLVAAMSAIARNSAESPRGVRFKSDLQPILDENCVTCHQLSSAPLGLDLEDGKSWLNLLHGRSAESKLPLISPGKPDESYLFYKLTGDQAKVGSGAQMPPGDPLPPDKIALVRRWIEDGAPNN